MPVIISLPSVHRNAGTYNTPSFTVGVSADTLAVAFSRAGLPAGNVADISMEVSHDSGSTWEFLGGINLGGGNVLSPGGQVAAESVYVVGFVDPDTGVPIPFAADDIVRATVVLHQSATAGIEVRAAP